MIGRIVGGLRSFLAAFLIGGVRFYQIALRPLLPALCRFQPSCSEYFILAVRKYGPLRGACKGVYRLCRCTPWGGSGYDPP
jgi:putative membrane protein insertion efficiency factor